MPGELIVEAHGSFATLVLSSYTNVINLARREKNAIKRRRRKNWKRSTLASSVTGQILQFYTF